MSLSTIHDRDELFVYINRKEKKKKETKTEIGLVDVSLDFLIFSTHDSRISVVVFKIYVVLLKTLGFAIIAQVGTNVRSSVRISETFFPAGLYS